LVVGGEERLEDVMTEKGSSIRSYRDLIVWQDGIKLTKEIYQLTREFPKHETYALKDQLCRAAVSVPSNIAEGQARKSPADFRRFLYIALGSLAELDTQIVIAQELEYFTKDQAQPLEEQIFALRRKLYALINSISK